MKQILNLFTYYLTWSAFSFWMLMTGLGFIALAVIGSLFEAGFVNPMLKLGFILSFVLPYAILPGIFRNLIANHRLSQLHGFHLKAGIALFLLTIMVSITLQAIDFILGMEGPSPRTAILFFFLASLYMGVMQLALPTPYLGQIFGFGSWMVIIPAVWMKRSMSPDFIYQPEILVPAIVMVLAGWAMAFYKLGTNSLFKPAHRQFAGDGITNKLWERHEAKRLDSTPSGTLLLGFPDGTWSGLYGTFFWVVGIPLAVTVAISLFIWLLPGPGDRPPSPFWVFYLFSGFVASFTSLPFGEMAARARLLWLRTGTDRAAQWRYLERILLRGQKYVWFWAIITTLLMSLTKAFSLEILVNYLVFIILFNLFWLYDGLAKRTLNLPRALSAVMFIGSISLLMWTLSYSFRNDDFTRLYLLEAGCVFAIVILRSITRKRFLGIDWHQVQPISFARLYGQQESGS